MEPVWSGYNNSSYISSYVSPVGAVIHDDRFDSTSWIDRELNLISDIEDRVSYNNDIECTTEEREQNHINDTSDKKSHSDSQSESTETEYNNSFFQGEVITNEVISPNPFEDNIDTSTSTDSDEKDRVSSDNACSDHPSEQAISINQVIRDNLLIVN